MADRHAPSRTALVAQARDSIVRGSKSFAAASRLFDSQTRERVWLLYAWCRRCDDLADDQDHGGVLGPAAGAQDRLATIRMADARYGVTVDTHTADGLFVAEPYREAGVKMGYGTDLLGECHQYQSGEFTNAGQEQP